ncbi:MAG: sugar ABC transporter permease [Specibacter sp.]
MTQTATRMHDLAGAGVEAPGPRRDSRRASGTLPVPVWGLLVPFLLFFAATYIVPIIYTVVKSLYSEKSGGGLGLGAPKTVFAGFDNYLKVFASADFWEGMGRVLLFGIIQVPFMVVFALLLSLVLDSIKHKVKGFFQFAFFLPYAVPGVIAALLWAYLYVPQLSPVVQGLTSIGIPADFLAPGTLLFSMANITTWCWTGYNMIILISALQAIPTDQYEAARLDGANEWQIATKIKVPNLRGAIGLTVLMSIVGTIQLFNEPTIIKTVSSNIDSNYVPMMMAYNTAFTAGDTGYSGAIAITMSMVAGILVYIYYRLSTRKD